MNVVSVAENQSAIEQSLVQHGVAILTPCDVMEAIAAFKAAGLRAPCTILDPWYNKGLGGTREDYDTFVVEMMRAAAEVSDHIFFWGFPEIVARFVERIPAPLELVAWLTWYYKNSPSVIRGWRSSQNACLHLSQPGAKLHPEHFMNAAQKEKQKEGKLRYMPGPTSVIEEPLLCGFVGKDEQTGHPAQKPLAVFQRIILMTTVPGDLVFDPMCGSGTAAEAAIANGRKAIISDVSEEYTEMAESRLGIPRVTRLGEHKSKAKGFHRLRTNRGAVASELEEQVSLPFQD